MAERITVAEELAPTRGYTPNVVRVVREGGTVAYVPCAELNADYEYLSRAVDSRQLVVVGATSASMLRPEDVAARTARREAMLLEQAERTR